MTRKLTMIVVSGFLFLTLAAGNLAASGYYLPFLSEIPEGSVGVFRSGDQLYDGVYTPGVYPVWPSDEVLLVSVLPEKTVVRESTCQTAEGITVEFGAITVAYRVLEGGVWMLVELFGVDFVPALIEKPVRQGLADWCANMTAEGVFLEKNGLLKQYLMDYLTNHLNVVQGAEKTGLLITGLEVSRAAVPDEVIDNLLKRTYDQAATEDDDRPDDQVATEDDQRPDDQVATEDDQRPDNQVATEDDQHPDDHEQSGYGTVVILSAPFEKEFDEEENGMDIVTDDPESPEESGVVLKGGDDTPLLLHPPVTDLSNEMPAALPSEDQIAAYTETVTVEMTASPEQSLAQDDGADTVPADHSGDSVAAEDQQDVQQGDQVSKSLWKNSSSRLYLGW